MQDLTQISDEALLERSQHGEYAASAELIVRYTPAVLYYAERYCYLGLEKEDLMQEGMIALLSAIRTYRGDRGAAFRTYASRCISNWLAKVAASQLRIVADLSEVELSTGSQTIPVRVYLDGGSDVGVVGEYNIVVSLTRE